MKFYEKSIDWQKDLVIHNLLGFKYSTKKRHPSDMSILEKARKLKIRFFNIVGYELDIENPKTFNEKINWMKILYRNEILHKIVDKYEFKNYIKKQLGDGYTVPLLGVWDNVEDIDFSKLPDRFVLKSNVQSGNQFINIIHDKNKIDIPELKKEMKNWLIPYKTLVTSFCYAYNDIKPQIIAEEYVEQINGQVYDYKFMCFGGDPKFILACSDRGDNTKYENYDTDWNLIIPSPKSVTKSNITKPKNFDKMMEIAKKLSAPFPFVRVDFYEIEDKIYVGEMTFYPNGGYNTYYPEFDLQFGSYINLPKVDFKFRPFFIEKLKYKNKHIVNVLGKKVKEYEDQPTTAELENKIEELENELKVRLEDEKLILQKNIYYFNEDKLTTAEKKRIVQERFYKEVGYFPNINNPKTLNEKINWYKLYYDNPLITVGCDKYKVKEYVSDIIGEEYVVPLLGVYDDADEIDFDKLPQSFALKVNFNTGYNIITKNKYNLDIDYTRCQLNKWIQPWRNCYWASFYQGYKNVEPKIIAEKYIDISENSTEYKIFCFNGKANFVLIELDYFGKEPKRAFYDCNFKETDFKIGDIPKVSLTEKPKNFDKMIELANKLAQPFPFVRVDFYDINNQIYFGELTFYSGGGYSVITPVEYDEKLGNLLDLSEVMQKYKNEN